jgi:hypothetical protein
MSDPRRFTLDELTIRAGTYFNPQTEILIVVDDSADVDHEVFDADEFESTEWVQISDESPIDESKRDELIEAFQSSYQSGDVGDEDHDDDDDDDRDDEDEDDDDDADDLELEME